MKSRQRRFPLSYQRFASIVKMFCHGFRPISLATIEDVLLCAPPETDIVCETVVADCKAALLSTTCPQILISVHLCQHIQSLGRVKIEIEGTTCTPRVEQQVDICPPHHIPSCPI
ncbi:hypothetical protein [Anoxybacillus flavithermus]|uniref:hypothetical protein n=1 Tax=Anoxybacillus flavithermus TaxID=33934 RepID=UPI001F51506C|nr:hypothetical protein [Anoxybacillus flavithermus]